MEEMKVKRTATKALRLSQEQAAQALSVLVSEGKLAAREVYGALKRREKLIRELRERLAALEKAGPFPIITAALKRAGRKATRKAKRRISAATRATWAAQGRYMAAVRRLPKAREGEDKGDSGEERGQGSGCGGETGGLLRACPV